MLVGLELRNLALQDFLDDAAHVNTSVRRHRVETVRHGVDGLREVVVHYLHQLVVAAVIKKFDVPVIVVIYSRNLESVRVYGLR